MPKNKSTYLDALICYLTEAPKMAEFGALKQKTRPEIERVDKKPMPGDSRDRSAWTLESYRGLEGAQREKITSREAGE
jgi:hypothetical protein